jgi:IS6 family transposase
LARVGSSSLSPHHVPDRRSLRADLQSPWESDLPVRRGHRQGADLRRALAELKKEGKCPAETLHRQIEYSNNTIEADHGKLKPLIRPVGGFKTLKTAYTTINGFEVMRVLRNGQASDFNITRDIRGEARIVERAFGLGAFILADALHLVGEHLELAAP